MRQLCWLQELSINEGSVLHHEGQLEMQQYTFDQILDYSIDCLPFVRRRVLRGRMARNARFRQDLLDEMALKLHDDEECQGLGFQMLFGTAVGSTVFSLTPEQFAKLVELFIKYLPLILQILF